MIEKDRAILRGLATAAGGTGIDFWGLLLLALEVKVALDYLANVPAGAPPAPPVVIPAGPGAVFSIVVSKLPAPIAGAERIGPPAQAAAPTPVPTVDLKLEHSDRFTNIELPTLTIWVSLVAKGQDGLAGDVLRAGLRAEHYLSLLPDDPAQVTTEQSATLTALLDALNSVIGQANTSLGTRYTI